MHLRRITFLFLLTCFPTLFALVHHVQTGRLLRLELDKPLTDSELPILQSRLPGWAKYDSVAKAIEGIPYPSLLANGSIDWPTIAGNAESSEFSNKQRWVSLELGVRNLELKIWRPFNFYRVSPSGKTCAQTGNPLLLTTIQLCHDFRLMTPVQLAELARSAASYLQLPDVADIAVVSTAVLNASVAHLQASGSAYTVVYSGTNFTGLHLSDNCQALASSGFAIALVWTVGCGHIADKQFRVLHKIEADTKPDSFVSGGDLTSSFIWPLSGWHVFAVQHLANRRLDKIQGVERKLEIRNRVRRDTEKLEDGSGDEMEEDTTTTASSSATPRGVSSTQRRETTSSSSASSTVAKTESQPSSASSVRLSTERRSSGAASPEPTASASSTASVHASAQSLSTMHTSTSTRTPASTSTMATTGSTSAAPLATQRSSAKPVPAASPEPKPEPKPEPTAKSTPHSEAEPANLDDGGGFRVPPSSSPSTTTNDTLAAEAAVHWTSMPLVKTILPFAIIGGIILLTFCVGVVICHSRRRAKQHGADPRSDVYMQRGQPIIIESDLNGNDGVGSERQPFMSHANYQTTTSLPPPYNGPQSEEIADILVVPPNAANVPDA